MNIVMLLIMGIVIAVLTVVTSVSAGISTAATISVAAIVYVLWMAQEEDGLEGLGAYLLGIVTIILAWAGVAVGLIVNMFR